MYRILAYLKVFNLKIPILSGEICAGRIGSGLKKLFLNIALVINLLI